MSTFTTTGPLVRFTDTEDAVSFTATPGRVSFTAAYQSVGGGGGGAVDSVNGETGTVVLDVDDVDGRDIYRPALVMSPASVTAFGGSMVDGVSLTIAALASSIAVGQDILIWNGTNGGAPNGSYTHAGSGTFNYSARQYLNATSFGNGCVKVVGNDYATSGAAGQLSEWDISTANGTTWGLYASGGHAYTQSLNLSQYALGTDIDTLEAADTAEAAARVTADRDLAVGVHESDGVAAELQPKFVSTVEAGAWSTNNLGPISTGLDVEFLVRPGVDYDGGFGEILSQPHTANGAGEDNLELAVWKADGTGGTVAGKLYLFVEITNTGASTESARAIFDANLREGVPVRGLVRINFGTNSCKAYTVAPTDEADLTVHGKSWVERDAVSNSGTWTSIDTGCTDDWYIGLNYTDGGIREVKAWHSTSLGTVLLDVNATNVPVGDTNFTDGNTVAWATTHGTVRHGVDARLDALESGGGGTVDVVSNVATGTILGRTTAGTGDSEELTAAQARSLLGQGWTKISDQTVASGGVASISVDVTGYSILYLLFAGASERNSGQDNLNLRFNNNSGSVYSVNSSALTTQMFIGAPPGNQTNTNRFGFVRCELHTLDGFMKSGISHSTNIGSTAAVAQSGVMRELFSTITAAVTSIQVFMSVGDIAAGSRLIVLGQ